jgi:hypothetical protein
MYCPRHTAGFSFARAPALRLHRGYTNVSANKLSPQQRDTMKARIAAGDAYADIAAAFGCTIDTVKYYGRKMKPAIAAAKATRQAAAIEQGFAAVDARVAELESLYRPVKADIARGIYGTDIKLSTTGKAVEVPVFKAQQFVQARGLLDDIAKERGGRKSIAEVTGKDGGAISFTLSFDRIAGDTDTDDQL